MDNSYAESDVSLSPSQILDRLQVLRQLQLLQRGKLQKQRLEYQETSETSSGLTEIVSHFSNSTSYSAFRSLLHSSYDASNEVTPRQNTSDTSSKVKEHDLIEGVAALNISQESEFIVNLPLSYKSRTSVKSGNDNINSHPTTSHKSPQVKTQPNKQIALDDVPILSPKQDFESLLLEKLKTDNVQFKNAKPTSAKCDKSEIPGQTNRPFLKKGEGMARFGVRRSDLIIQNTKALPWRQKNLKTRVTHTPKKVQNVEKDSVQIVIKEPKELKLTRKKRNEEDMDNKSKNKTTLPVDKKNSEPQTSQKDLETISEIEKPIPKLQLPTGKHPLKVNQGKTWAAVLTKEQDDFLRQLKQSNYYKNFTSPAKSIVSDASCDEHLTLLRQQKESAEQNVFELIENKVTNDSFNIDSSFFNKFLKRNFECSGESTPLVMQKCLTNNPQLYHIFPDLKMKGIDSHSECSCQYTDCSDACSVSSCSTCKTVEEVQTPEVKKNVKEKDLAKKSQATNIDKQDKECQDDTVTETHEIKAEMAEMNAKLVATSELLKERLQELEDEIETFRKENLNLAKMREEIDVERQKFYEEKKAFEQKFNEDKILSEYYLAEEKEKLTKQKQMYERYVREIRGRLNKKEKDEVLNLKKEISDLKEEIRAKDAKSTATIARLRNQLKIMEKEKVNLESEVEKLKKENRRIQHSNDITRRLTNVKYLEEINKKLRNMSKNTQSEIDLDNDVKFKSYEIERQSRSRRVQPVTKSAVRPRAKSVPNLNVTSRYAKYFSQRDALSHAERLASINIHDFNKFNSSDNVEHNEQYDLDNDTSDEEFVEEPYEEENNLEKLYIERFQNSPSSSRSSLSNNDKQGLKDNPDSYFIRKSNPNKSNSAKEVSPYAKAESYTSRSKSPVPILSNRSRRTKSPMRELQGCNTSAESKNSTSPVSILSNRTSYSQRLPTVINQEHYREQFMNVSPEPSTSKTNTSKTNLNPTEIKKPDGSKELRFPNGNIKYISADGKYSRFVYYNGDVKENFYSEGRIKYYYAETKTYHTTHADGLEVLEFPDGQVEKRYKDGSSEIRLPNGSVRYHDPKNEHVREEWRFPDGTAVSVSANGEKRVVFSNGQVEVHAKDHKRREFPDGTVKLVYTDGTSETRYASGRVRIKDKHGNLIMDSAPG